MQGDASPLWWCAARSLQARACARARRFFSLFFSTAATTLVASVTQVAAPAGRAHFAHSDDEHAKDNDDNDDVAATAEEDNDDDNLRLVFGASRRQLVAFGCARRCCRRHCRRRHYTRSFVWRADRRSAGVAHALSWSTLRRRHASLECCCCFNDDVKIADVV